MLNIDTTKAHRTPLELLDLVNAVLNAGAADEDDTIEWKSGLDLAQKDGLVPIVKGILAFANRDPVVAARAFGGLGYFIVGAEPGNFGGVEELDVADLDAKMRPYLGHAGPRWTPTYVHNAGVVALVIVIDPPRPGDDIWALRKELGKYRDGTIFVRNKAKSEPASSADLDMLKRRYLQQADRLELHLELEADVDNLLAVLDVSEDALTEWVDAEHERVMAPLVWRKEAQQRGLAAPSPFASAIQHTQKVAAIAASISALSEPDTRTEADFIDEVDAYLKEARAELPNAALAALSKIAPPMRLVLVNDTERNFANVSVDALLRGPVIGIDDPLDPVKLPAPPRALGTPTRSSRFPAIAFGNATMPHLSAAFLNPRIASTARRPTITNTAEGVRIEFPSIHVRPHARIPLDDVVCIATENIAGEILPLEWTATASDANGEAGEQLAVTVDATASTPLDLLGDDDKASEDDE
jgi:hypothetical protein